MSKSLSQEKTQMKINHLKKHKHLYLIHTSEKVFNGTFLNRGLPYLNGGLLEITLTVSLTN